MPEIAATATRGEPSRYGAARRGAVGEGPPDRGPGRWSCPRLGGRTAWPRSPTSVPFPQRVPYARTGRTRGWRRAAAAPPLHPIPLTLALPSGRRDRRRLAPGGIEGFSGNAFGPMMATFHRAAGDRRGALS